MKSTRERIIQTLLLNPKSTINDLANAVDINAISVRHHITSLQVEGLVLAQEERHGIGRPRLVYSLTESGAELFPTRYLRLVNQLFTQLKSRLTKTEMENSSPRSRWKLLPDTEKRFATCRLIKNWMQFNHFC